MSGINGFLLQNDLRIRTNPCISPDFCLDWPALRQRIRRGDDVMVEWGLSRVETADAFWTVIEDGSNGDCAWRAEFKDDLRMDLLEDGVALDDRRAAVPATCANALRMKNLVQEFHPSSTVFPTAGSTLGTSTLGIGARFTTLHWPAVEWAMAALDMGLTASQNSVPRELVYDVDAMLAGRLDVVPFPFIGTSVPEGHQGQSIEGMAHGAVLSKLRTGFHRRHIAWSLNADHQPIGGKFDAREERLVAGSLLASYITFDLSPELVGTPLPDDAASWVTANVPDAVVAHVTSRLAALGLGGDRTALCQVIASVWPAMLKMKRRNERYAAARETAFTTEIGRAYLRELSIDELPGLTRPDTTATVLALCEALGMTIHFVAPAFGFQKNAPCADNDRLRTLVEPQWAVCHAFGVGIGFHSGSGKSAENYAVMGKVTGGRLEIKTSGRFTYEMGCALAASANTADGALWRDWYHFTVEMAISGAHSADTTERAMARSFVTDALENAGHPSDVFGTPEATRSALERLSPSPDHMFWFEYNFLFVLAADGRADRTALGDHSARGYRQRARFYSISDDARLRYMKNVAAYVLFLAEHTGLVPAARCDLARADLDACESLGAFLARISPS